MNPHILFPVPISFTHSSVAYRIPAILKFLLILTALVTLAAAGASAQFFSVSGLVTDERGTPLAEANVALFTKADTLLLRGAPASQDGTFTLRRVPEGSYSLIVSYLGYQSAMIPVEVRDRDITGLHIRIQQQPFEMDGLEITARPEPVQVRGDTTVFTAAAYPVRSDAVAEDLLRRMPGFTIENGRVQAQGEEVRQVLVDGREFFGDDPSVALRNLPADIIRQIEVFDQASEQAQFTGFNDGETIRTVNIITRSGIRDGHFGRVNVSLGTDERYLGGGNINFFNGDRRISILGLANNINQVNFTSDYLTGVAQAGQSTSMRGGGGGGGGGGGAGRTGDWSRPDNTTNFLLGEQQGINTVQSFGLNYVDRWSDSWRVTGSYFFNHTANTNDQILERQFLEDEATGDRYLEQSFSDAKNYNHRFNARIEHTIDPLRSVIIRPRLDLSPSSSSRAIDGLTTAMSSAGTGVSSIHLNESSYLYESDQLSWDFNNSILYRRRFDTRGRTFSVNLLTRADTRTGDQFQLGESRFYGDDWTTEAPADPIRTIIDDQFVDLTTWNRSVSANIQYTEPLTERSQVFFGYAPSLDFSKSDRNIFRLDGDTKRYDVPDLRLTSQYENREIAHRPSIGYRLRGDGFHFNTSLAWQYTSVDGEQTFPRTTETSRTFSNLLPRAMLRYRFSEATDLRLMYHTRTRTPSVIQLQDVIDVSDPLLWTGGNPDLKEQYLHRIIMRYRSIRPETMTSLLAYFTATWTQDFIGNRTILADRDMEISNGMVLERGGRLILPDQSGNAWDIRSFLNYSLPAPIVRSNLNLNTGGRYRETPSIINDRRNMSHQTDIDAGVNINSVISPEVDFTLAYTAGYRFVRNSIREDLDDDYYTGRASVRFSVLPWNWLVLESDLNLLHFEGLSDEFNRNITFWNASVGYRFLSNRAAQLRLTVTDILGQNSSINRTVTDFYIQDTQSQVLTRYVMFSLSYNFRSLQEGI
jgi:hypothetical protein